MPISREQFVAAFSAEKPAKPTKKLFFSGDLRSTKKEIQEVFNVSAGRNLKKLLDDLADSDPKFAAELVAYKMEKHKDDFRKWSKYLLSLPKDLWTPEQWDIFKNGGFDWVDDSAWANEIVDALSRMSEKDQQTLLSKNSGQLVKVLEGYLDRKELTKLLDEFEGIDEALGISKEDKTKFTNALSQDPFDIVETQKKLAVLSEKHKAKTRLGLLASLDEEMKSSDKKAWTKLLISSKEYWGDFGFSIAQLGAQGDFGWVTKQHAGPLRDLLLEQKGSGRVAWLQNQTFLAALKEADPKIFSELVDSIPQLKSVFGVADKLLKDGVDPNSQDYLKRGAEGIFDALLGQGDNKLTGFEYLADASRAGRLEIDDWLSGAIEGTTGGPCSVLTNVLTKLAQSWPGPGKLSIKIGEIIPPVMTRPLSDVDPRGLGMVTRGFAGKSGNVFENGAPTGRVFFSGGSSGAAHTWVIINDVPFDSLFGTKGDDVASVEDERFDLHPKKPDRWVGQKTGRLLIKDKKLKNTGSGMGFASYRLEPKPE